MMRPWWVTKVLRYYPRKIIKSGTVVVDGNVQSDPAAMAKKAGLTREEYTLARYVSSEHGSHGSPEEKMLIAMAAVNRVRNTGSTIDRLLLFNQPVGHPNRGFYGPIHDGGVSSHPFGRWASTARDPGVDDVVIARLALSGDADDFTDADYQWAPRYSLAAGGINGVTAFEGVDNKAARRDYWIGHLPNVNPHEVMGYVHLPNVKASSSEGKRRIEAAKEMLRSPGVYPKPTEIESRRGWLLVPAVAGLAWLGWRYRKRLSGMIPRR